MASKKNSEKRFERLKKFDDQTMIKVGLAINSETDRGAVLVALAVVDRLLGVLLKAKIQRASKFDEEEVNLILAGEQAILYSLYSRSKIAHAFGLIDRGLLESIDRLRGLRNKFAHAEFVDPLSKSQVDSIAAPLQDYEKELLKHFQSKFGNVGGLRGEFGGVIAAICAGIDRCIYEVEKAQPSGKTP